MHASNFSILLCIVICFFEAHRMETPGGIGEVAMAKYKAPENNVLAGATWGGYVERTSGTEPKQSCSVEC